MRYSTNRRSFFSVMVLALLLAIVIPATALGQGRGRGHGRGNVGNIGWSKYDKKCAKFVNCHDASDGRVDGRGPRGQRVGNVIWRNRNRHRTINNNRWLRLRRARLNNRNN
jgi:hypothetical protein